MCIILLYFFIFLFIFLYMIPNYLYSQCLVFVQALHLYFNVAISNSFNFIFEADVT